MCPLTSMDYYGFVLFSSKCSLISTEFDALLFMSIAVRRCACVTLSCSWIVMDLYCVLGISSISIGCYWLQSVFQYSHGCLWILVSLRLCLGHV